MLYVELCKALYGLMRSALLFYRKLKGEQIAYRFEMNPYNACMANKVTKDGEQLTVMWHVDNLQASCVHGHEITKLFLYLKRLYGNRITINHSKKFEFLGMQLDYSEPGVFGVDMEPYIETILNDWPELITRGREGPHNKNFSRSGLTDPKHTCPRSKQRSSTTP